MKLHRLEITAMGPFAGTETIDFDRLDQAGVYLLTGRTGSGKTTVLDAVGYAIFGEIPRNAKGADLVSHHRQPGTVPQVTLELTLAGKHTRIRRSPGYLRPAKRGDGMTPENQTLRVEDRQSGEWTTVASGWTEGNEELAARIGMTADQFNQVAMLPQGQFEKFLDSAEKDRRLLLRQLFPGADLEWLEDWLKRETTAARVLRDAKTAEIDQHFRGVLRIAQRLQANERTEAGDAADTDPLPERSEAGPAIEWIERTDTDLAAISTAREKTTAAAEATRDSAREQLDRLKTRTKLIERRQAAETQLARLAERQEWVDQTGEKIAAARRAAPVKSLAETSVKRGKEREEAGNKLELLRPAVESGRLTVGIPTEKFKQHREQLEAEVRRTHDFIWNELPGREKQAERAGELEKKLAALTSDGAENPVAQAENTVKEREAAAAEAALEYIEIRNARTAGMAQELAGSLEDDKPCPVCGSTDHPAPASGEDEVPSRAKEEAAEEQRGRAVAAEKTARQELAETKEKAAADRTKTESELGEARKSLKQLKESEIELCGDAISVEDRHEQLAEAVKLLDGYLEADRNLREAAAAATTAESEAADSARDNDFESVEAALDAALDPAELKKLEEDTDKFNREISIVRNDLAGELAEIDPREVIDLTPAREALAEASAALDLATRESATANQDRDDFRKQTGPVPDLYTELAPLRKAADRVAELSDLASGDNERKLRLSNFFLATRLRQVIEAANHRLTVMSDQRYTLVYSDEKGDGRSKSGLGIEVYDSHTSQARPTGTLSGGEKFCAALSLALGLAEVVQMEADGKRLETLFIDEGFGTLDAESLEQVMTVIDSLREGGRSVGLVSHVEELRNRVPAQIQVTKGSNGSTLEVKTG